MFDLILYVPSTIFQINRDRSSWVEPVLSQDKYVLLKDHNAVMPVRLKPAAPQSQVKHPTTEPLRSLCFIIESCYKQIILQRNNYRKMTIIWSFSYNYFEKFQCKNIWKPCSCQICAIIRCDKDMSINFH